MGWLESTSQDTSLFFKGLSRVLQLLLERRWDQKRWVYPHRYLYLALTGIHPLLSAATLQHSKLSREMAKQTPWETVYSQKGQTFHVFSGNCYGNPNLGSLKTPCTVSPSKHSNEHPCILAEMTVHGKLTPIKWRKLKKDRREREHSILHIWIHGCTLKILAWTLLSAHKMKSV